MYVIHPGMNRNDWKSMRWAEEEQEESVAFCRYPSIKRDSKESFLSFLSHERAHQAQPRGTCLAGPMASAQLTVPGRASLRNRDEGLPLLCYHPSSADFEILIVLKV